MNGRNALEGGRWLKAWVCADLTQPFATRCLLLAQVVDAVTLAYSQRPPIWKWSRIKYNIHASVIGIFTHCMASEFQNTLA